MSDTNDDFRYSEGSLLCPYCGFEHKESDVFTSETRRSNVFGGEWWCDNCGLSFSFDAIATKWSFMSDPYETPELNLGFQPNPIEER